MKHIHFIGIGGTGLSAIARLLLESGYTVSGSDRVLSPLARDLEKLGVRVFTGHEAAHVSGADLVIRSSAVQPDNPEVKAALEAGIPVIKRHDFLADLMAPRRGIAISGTHGKTTTTAMIAWMLTQLGLDPSYIIGGVSKDLGNNAHAGKGDVFVLEADEYDRTFLSLRPEFIVITNVEHDHPDCYPTPEEYTAAFVEFAGRLKPGGKMFICADDPGSQALSLSIAAGSGAEKTIYRYALNAPANYRANHLRSAASGGYAFNVIFRSDNGEATLLAETELQVPGEHNVRNALAALAVAHQMGLDVQAAAGALARFSGAGRRFDLIGEANGVAVVDDYAHHPTEIRATLAAARSRFPGRQVWALWQPHTYSRTQMLFDEFISAFSGADQVVITEVYASREKNNGFSSASLVEKIPGAHFSPSLQEASQYLLGQLAAGDVLLVLSAGDADWVGRDLLEKLSAETARGID